MLALFAAAALFVVASGTERALRGSSEFMGFRRIVQVSVVEDKNHYEEVIQHIRAYPPFFGIFWSPFGLFPLGRVPDYHHPLRGTSLAEQVQLGLSAFLLLAAMTAMTVWAVRCVMAACLGQEGEGAAWCGPALLWVLCGGLMLNGTVRCETDMFVVMLLAGGLYLMLASGRQWGGGALLGVAAAFKVTPGLFAVYLLCRRNWRALGGMIAAGVACTILLPAAVWGPGGAVERHRSWLTKVIIPYATEGPEHFISHAYRRANQSPKAALVRYLTHYNAGRRRRPEYVNVADLPAGTVEGVAMALKLLILAALVAAWLRAPASAGRELEALLFGLVPLGMLLLSDISHGSHLAVLAVPLGALTAYCFRHEGEAAGRRVSWGVLAGFLLANLIAVRSLKTRSVGTAGILVLFGLSLCLALRLGAARRPEPQPHAE
jgi:hypothetical protein